MDGHAFLAALGCLLRADSEIRVDDFLLQSLTLVKL